MGVDLAAHPEIFMAMTAMDSVALLLRFLALAIVCAAPWVLAWPYDADIPAPRRPP
jgi:hypothetical protein